MIIIDPGHGGRDSGAVGPSGIKEKDIVLRSSRKIQVLLEHFDYRTRLTRNDDSYPNWSERVESNKDDLFISIHCNGASSQAQGIETLYYSSSSKGKKLASLIQEELIKSTDRRDRGIKSRDDLYVLRKTKCPAVLVEAGFISNFKEEELLNSADYQTKVARAIVEAIKEYFNYKE